MDIAGSTLDWIRTEIAQSVYRRAMDWTARVRFPAVQVLSLFHSVQADSGVHQASYPMGIGGSFPGR
jgi:hypothetical protein